MDPIGSILNLFFAILKFDKAVRKHLSDELGWDRVRVEIVMASGYVTILSTSICVLSSIHLLEAVSTFLA